MEKKTLKKGAMAAGGVALLAVVSTLCVKGMQAVDKRLKAKKEAEAVEAAELFEETVAVEPAEETGEETEQQEITE